MVSPTFSLNSSPKDAAARMYMIYESYRFAGDMVADEPNPTPVLRHLHIHISGNFLQQLTPMLHFSTQLSPWDHREPRAPAVHLAA